MKTKKPYYITINPKTKILIKPNQNEEEIRLKWQRILGENLGLEGTAGSRQEVKGYKNKSQK
jgi:hypothetical protein